jgi:drug/metabolite transporter (DMT)-like permease
MTSAISSSTAGLIWCAAFVVLDATQAVAFGTILQTMDGFLIGLLAFGLSSLGCLMYSAWQAPVQLRTALSDPGLLLWANIHAAGGWLTYLGALQLIEPAVSLTIYCGVLPLATIAAARAGVREAEGPKNTLEAGGNVILAAGVLALVAVTLAGWSGFVRGGFVAGLAGALLSALSGVFIAGMLVCSFRMDGRGVGPAAQFALRFPVYLGLAFSGYLLGLDDKGPVPAVDLIVAVGIGFVLLALPSFAVQKAVSLTSSLTIGAAAALTPVLVFLIQLLEGRVDYSRATLAGLTVYVAGALIAAWGRWRAVTGEAIGT